MAEENLTLAQSTVASQLAMESVRPLTEKVSDVGFAARMVELYPRWPEMMRQNVGFPRMRVEVCEIAAVVLLFRRQDLLTRLFRLSAWCCHTFVLQSIILCFLMTEKVARSVGCLVSTNAVALWPCVELQTSMLYRMLLIRLKS